MSAAMLREWTRYLHTLNRTVGRYRAARVQEFRPARTAPTTLDQVRDLDDTYAEIARIEKDVNR